MAATAGRDGEVLGRTVEVAVDGVMSVFQSRMRKLLDEQGIERPDPDPGEWYSLDRFLRVLETVEDDVGENALTKVGEATPEFTEWSTDANSPAEALKTLTTIFEENHRNVASQCTFERVDKSTGRITSNTPYPTAWEAGLIKGAAESRGSRYTRVTVVEESSNDETVFEVNW